jgi:glucokinase
MSVLAVDLGGSHITCGLVSETQVLAAETVHVEDSQRLKTLLPSIASMLKNLLAEHGRASNGCSGIGFSFCGIVDVVHSRILSANGKYVDGPDLDLVSWAEREFGLPIRLENDARTALLGERYAGAGRGFDDIVMLTLGTGIGGAAMLGGQLIRSKHSQAGCLGGHLVIDYRGRRCSCGNVGCLEAEASSWALPGLCAAHPDFESSALGRLPHITFRDLFQLAALGDCCACQIRDQCIAAWAAGAVSLIHSYDPELVILGGGVMNAAEQIVPRVREHIVDHAWTPWGQVEVRVAALGCRASLLGAIPLLEQFIER